MHYRSVAIVTLAVVIGLALTVGGALYAQDKGDDWTPKVKKGDNMDDDKSGKKDRVGDGNSGQGDDKERVKCEHKWLKYDLHLTKEQLLAIDALRKSIDESTKGNNWCVLEHLKGELKRLQQDYNANCHPDKKAVTGKGDNKDDAKSGKVDKKGDGDSGEGNDWHIKYSPERCADIKANVEELRTNIHNMHEAIKAGHEEFEKGRYALLTEEQRALVEARKKAWEEHRKLCKKEEHHPGEPHNCEHTEKCYEEALQHGIFYGGCHKYHKCDHNKGGENKKDHKK